MKIKEAVAKRITDLCKERNIAINALCSMLSFCYQIVNFQAKKPLFMRFFGLYDLFPLVAENYNLTLFVYKPCDVVFVLF